VALVVSWAKKETVHAVHIDPVVGSQESPLLWPDTVSSFVLAAIAALLALPTFAELIEEIALISADVDAGVVHDGEDFVRGARSAGSRGVYAGLAVGAALVAHSVDFDVSETAICASPIQERENSFCTSSAVRRRIFTAVALWVASLEFLYH
jgi:hypothetical protein